MNVYPTSISRPTATPPRRICSGGGGSGSGADVEELKTYIDSTVASVRGELHESVTTLKGYVTDQLGSYLTKSNAESTYAKLEKLTNYLTKSDAASTYATVSDLATALSLKVPPVKDNAGGYTSVVVGSLDTESNPSVGQNVVAVGSGNKASGNYALVVGTDNTLRGNDAVCFGRQSSAGSSAFAIGVNASAGAEGFAFGYNVKAGGSSYPYSMALGRDADASAPNIFVWNGVELSSTRYAGSRSDGTFNVNPEGGTKGFYVGDKNLKTIISEEASPHTKRDKTDNIAAADTFEFSEWTIHCDEPEIQAAVREAFASGKASLVYTEVGPGLLMWRLSGLPQVEGYEVVNTTTGPEGPDANATEVIVHAVYQTSSKEVGIRATRTRVDLAKVGESYVTPTWVRDLATTKFHQLDPETTDDKVVLKPVDGKANWVEGVVDLKERITRFLSANFTLNADYESPLPDEGAPLYARYTCQFALKDGDFELLTDLDSLSFDFTGGGIWESFESIYIKLNKEIDITSTWERDIPADAVIDGFPTRLTAGTVIDLCRLLFFYDSEEGYPSLKENNIELWSYESDYLSGLLPASFHYNGTELYYGSCGGDFSFKQTVEKKRPCLTVNLPDKDSHITAKRLSIALTSEGTSVSEVAWHGATEIIEAFPGASKLAVGTTVWDVKEVAPGKLLVNRAPGATGDAVTITGDNGTVYTLAVDSEGTLEVRA